MRCSTRSAMVGAIWKPLAPAPTSATRLPVRSTSWSQRAEWNDGPAKRPPGMSGRFGRLSWPTAEITARAVERLAGRRGATCPRARSPSSHVAPSTSVSQRTCSLDAVLAPSRPRSTPAARAAGRRTRSSGRSARSCSSRSGCRRRPARRGSEFSHQVPPTPAFFSTTVNGMPASCRRIAGEQAGLAAADDDDRARPSAAARTARRRRGRRRRRAPSPRASSGTYSSGTSSHTSQAIIS